jgi:hypothetical protein
MQLIGSRTAAGGHRRHMRCAKKAQLYTLDFAAENDPLRTENTFLWNENIDGSGT